MLRARTLLALLFALALIALPAAGCGDDTGDPDGGSPPSGSAAAETGRASD